MMSDLSDRIASARKRADLGGLPVRRKDATLYALLAECLSICEDVLRDDRMAELRDILHVSVDVRGQGNAGRGRRYVETGSDAYVLVARAVLEGIDNRNSVYRYATALREAAKRQIAGRDLAAWLSESGGVHALYCIRRIKDRVRTLKTIHLNQSVVVPPNGVLRLYLRRDMTGNFNVEASE